MRSIFISILSPNITRAYPGHLRSKLALMKMYRTTGNKKWLLLAEHFINKRGEDPLTSMKRKRQSVTGQCGKQSYVTRLSAERQACKAQSDATGHAVRAVYLYTGMAQLSAKMRR